MCEKETKKECDVVCSERKQIIGSLVMGRWDEERRGIKYLLGEVVDMFVSLIVVMYANIKPYQRADFQLIFCQLHLNEAIKNILGKLLKK